MGMNYSKVIQELLALEEGRAVTIYLAGMPEPLDAAHGYMRDDAPVWVVSDLQQGWEDCGTLEVDLGSVVAFRLRENRDGEPLFVDWPRRGGKNIGAIGTREQLAEWQETDRRYFELVKKRRKEGADALTEDEAVFLSEQED
jgi:hypothetical protein